MEQPLHITKTTFRVSDFLAWQRHDALDLRPPFQRGSVWSARAKSLFIDTIIRGFPVPLVFLKDETNPETFEPRRLVVDGQQRLRTVLAFIDESVISDATDVDHFTVSKTHNPDREIYGRPFGKLPEAVRTRILDFEFSVHVLPPATPNRVLLDMFARLNSTGTKLNDQEVRNAEFTGEFKVTAYGLAYDYLDQWLRWKVFTPAQVARMKEVELTSELMMFLLGGMRSKSQAAIRTAYSEHEETFELGERVVDRFVAVLSALDEIDRALPNGLAGSRFNSQSWFYALFAWLHGLMYPNRLPKGSDRPAKLDAAACAERMISCGEALAEGDLDETLSKALRGAASDRSSREARLNFLISR